MSSPASSFRGRSSGPRWTAHLGWSAVHVCPACHRRVQRFRPGPRGGRVQARCPHCRSLERHRFLAILLDGLGPMLPSARVLLEVAPSAQTERILSRTQPGGYVRLDLGDDPRAVDVRGDLTALPLADDSVDVAVCYHVLEHIPDDAAAMRE